MSKQYLKCEPRATAEDKQNNQRLLDKIFKNLTGKTNPFRKKEEDSTFNTIRSLQNTFSDIQFIISQYMGYNRR